jgi:hypothetical protein
MNESTEQADVFRAHVAEARDPNFQLRAWQQHVSQVGLVAVTDCKSLYDHLNKQGSAPPDDKRLSLDMQVLRDMMENGGLRVRWVATQQMIADPLTKASPGNYLSHVLRTGVFHITRHPEIDWVYLEEKEREKLKLRDFLIEHRRAQKRKKIEPQEKGEQDEDETMEGSTETLAAVTTTAAAMMAVARWKPRVWMKQHDVDPPSAADLPPATEMSVEERRERPQPQVTRAEARVAEPRATEPPKEQAQPLKAPPQPAWQPQPPSPRAFRGTRWGFRQHQQQADFYRKMVQVRCPTCGFVGHVNMDGSNHIYLRAKCGSCSEFLARERLLA